MEHRDFILDAISAKLKRERAIELARGEEFGGRRPDAILKSSGSVLGLIVMAFDEGDDEVVRRVGEMRGLGPQVYLLVQKGRQKRTTDILWKRSLFDVKVMTWDIEIGL